ncbi:hypothetical protein [Chryseobacterium paludis]|uniref:hypothetical protein n=1 Tax=Chryseobacterium paludis TaxID=2956784 RepID=UPI0021C15C0A|nr:hypothetical protein [Chryseobacterium paludis]
MKKSTKFIIAGIVLIIILAFVFNPFYWLMRPSQKPEQPQLSTQEQVYFKELEKRYNSKLKRFYYNYTKKGTDTLFEKNYNKVPFEYSLSIDIPANSNIPKDSLFSIAQYVKNSILNNNKNLKKIIIYKNYDTHEYLFDADKNALIEKKN